MEEKTKEIWHEQRMNGEMKNERKEKVGENKETANEGRGKWKGGKYKMWKG